MIKAGKEETNCLLDIGGKGSFMAFVQVPVKGLKYDYATKEQVRNNGKAERSCLLVVEKGSVHVEHDSWGMKKSGRKPASPNVIIILLNTPCRRKKIFLVEGGQQHLM